MTIDPYYQQQKCRPIILFSGYVRCMQIFVGVPPGGAYSDSGDVNDGIFSELVAISSGTLESSTSVIYCMRSKCSNSIVVFIKSQCSFFSLVPLYSMCALSVFSFSS